LDEVSGGDLRSNLDRLTAGSKVRGQKSDSWDLMLINVK